MISTQGLSTLTPDKATGLHVKRSINLSKAITGEDRVRWGESYTVDLELDYYYYFFY